MKKLIVYWVLLCSLLGVFCGCAKQENITPKVDTNNAESTTGNVPDDKSDVAATNNGNSGEAIASGEEEHANQVAQFQTGDYPCMVMLEDKLYVDTGEISRMARCGNMDFTFTSHVKSGEPKNNGETNFDSPIEGQYGTRENRIELYYGDAWHIFAYQEDNFEGVTMRVTKFDKKGAVLTIYNDTETDIIYGEDYIIEQYNEEQETWEPVEPNPQYGFHDIAYTVEKSDSQVVFVDWKDNYGELTKGKYRIVKKMLDVREPGDYDTYTLMAEFVITEQTNSKKDL